MAHFLYDRNGTVNVSMINGNAYKLPFDTIIAEMNVDSQFVRVDSVYFHNKFSFASARGNLNYVVYPQRLSFDTLVITAMGLSLNNDSSIAISIDSGGYRLDRVKLKRSDGFIEGVGRVDYNDSMQLKIDLSKINIVPLIKLLDTNYVPGGVMSGQFLVSGTFGSPLIEFLGRIDSLSYSEFVLGDLTADLSYAEKVVQVDSIIVDSHTGRYVAKGTFPIDLSFTSEGSRFTGAGQNIDFTAHDTRLDAVSLFLQEVESLKGDFNADFKLTGTAKKPKINGRIGLANGALKISDLVQPLEKLNIAMTLDNQTVTIDSISGICRGGKKVDGTVTGSGQIIINSIEQLDYNLKIKLANFPANMNWATFPAWSMPIFMCGVLRRRRSPEASQSYPPRIGRIL